MNVTFYVPTLNSEKTIEECLKSIFAKEVKPKDVMIIDGNSTDNTIKIANKLKVKVIKQEQDGLANARTLALKNCKTKFIASIDSDCILEKNWLENVMKNFNKNTAGVCGKLIEKNVNTIYDKWRAYHLKQDWGNKKIINPKFLFGSNSVFRVESLKKIGSYREMYKTNYEDVDISMKLKQNGFNIIYEPSATCYHLKKDDLLSIIATARKWSFYSYSIPNSFIRILMRLLIYNPYLFVNFLVKDLLKLKFNFIHITLLGFFYNQIFDIGYYLKK
ncbi:MAG: glycosyltransferase family 2 protein [Nanoarchaeota archaeon]